MSTNIKELIKRGRGYADREGVRAEPVTGLLADAAERLLPQQVTETSPEDGVPVLGFSQSWKDGDHNPSGVRDCWRLEGKWMSARWNPNMDAWDVDEQTAPSHFINPTVFGF